MKSGKSNQVSSRQIVLYAMLPAALLAGGAAAQLHAVPLTDPVKVYLLDGYRVSPPPGKNWFELQYNRQQAIFGKKLGSPTHSFGAIATSEIIGEKFETREQFQDYVIKQRTANFEATRFRVIEFESAVDNTYAAWCIHYRLKHTDRDAVLSRNRMLLVEDFGITCLHPEKKDLVVDVGYSERGHPAELSAELRKEGESFMHSLEFIRP